jgi:hypothetical protein
MQYLFARLMPEERTGLFFGDLEGGDVITHCSITRKGHANSQLGEAGWKADLEKIPCAFRADDEGVYIPIPNKYLKYLIPGNYIFKLYSEGNSAASHSSTISWDGKRKPLRPPDPPTIPDEPVDSPPIVEENEEQIERPRKNTGGTGWGSWGKGTIPEVKPPVSEEIPDIPTLEPVPNQSPDVERPRATPSRQIKCPFCHRPTFFSPGKKCNVCGKPFK